MMKVRAAPCPEYHSSSALKQVPQVASIVVCQIGCLVLVGWMLDIAPLKSIFPNLVTMKANTALALLLSGGSLWLLQQTRRRKLGGYLTQAGAFVVAAIGLLSLSQYLFGWDFGIDQLLFAEPLGSVSTSHSGRMAPNTALNFILVGAALFLLSLKTRKATSLAQYLALIVALISWQPLLGYAYQFRSIYGIGQYTHMALHTAIAFLILCLGLLCVHPAQGIMAIVTSNSVGGFIARRLLIAAIAIPSIVGYFIIQGYRANLYYATFGLSLLVMVNIVFFAVIIWQNAQALETTDKDRHQALSALQKLTLELESRVEERTSELKQANTALKQQIIERQRAEEALYNRQQELKALLENTPDVIIRCDRQFRYVYVNPEVERCTGMPASFFLGKSNRELGSAEELCSLWESTMQAVFDTATEQTIEFQAPSVRGMRDYQSRVVPELDRDGTVKYALIVSRDITDRKQAEEALRLRESTLRQYFELPLVGIAITSPEQGWLEVNQKLCDLLGYSRQELLQMTWVELTAPEDLETDLKQFEAVLAGEIDGYSLDKRYIRKDGKIVEACISTRCVRRSDGSVDYFVALIQDISDRKQAEEERAQLIREQAARIEAEAANQMKDEFLATLSHELRTPINCILGWAQLLRSRQLNEKTRDRALETIERNAKLQTQLVEDLLDVSRIIQNKLNLKYRLTHLAIAIRSAIATVRPLAEAKSIQIYSHLDDDVGTIWGDPNRIEQIVWNLLSNAIKFTPEGGRVEIRLWQTTDLEGSTSATIQVSDTGKGISGEFLPYVFERFRQADNSITRAYGGLGLGLAIVRNLVELHQGTIEATSLGEGQGATFTVKFPTALNQRSREKSKRLNSASAIAKTDTSVTSILQGLRVLVVDDDTDTRELIDTVLQQYGVQVMLAESVEQALAAFKQAQPDILISDIGMPQVNGYEFIRQVRNSELGLDRAIPAIALTAYARDTDRLQALEAGFSQHLAKPVEPQGLIAAIATSLEPRSLNFTSNRLDSKSA